MELHHLVMVPTSPLYMYLKPRLTTYNRVFKYSVHLTVYYAWFLMYILTCSTMNMHDVCFESHYHVKNKRIHTYNVCCVALSTCGVSRPV